MSPFTFVPLGVGDAFSAAWYSSCLLLQHAGARLLVDCPHPIRKMLREAPGAEGADVADIEAVVLTHLHADHSSGLEGFGYYSRFVLGRRARLVAHPHVLARAWDGHLAAGMESLLAADATTPEDMRFSDYFEVTPLDFAKPTRVGPFDIECRPTRHHVPTTALRISAGGRRLGYSADTSFDSALIDWLAESELVLHETNHGIHTPHAALAALPAELRARMRLIHFPDDFAEGAIEALRQGQSYEV